MQEISLSADELVAALLTLAGSETVCLLDSCGAAHLGSHLLVAGIRPLETFEVTHENPEETLALLDQKLAGTDACAFFTIAYDFGLKLNRLASKNRTAAAEPDLFLALFECLVLHDYRTGKSYLGGNRERFGEMETLLRSATGEVRYAAFGRCEKPTVKSNFSKTGYLAAIEVIKEFIRRGDTYQTNLTQQLRAELPANLAPQQIFWNLRKNHPAPFGAFLRRKDSVVVSASPERFFKVRNLETASADAGLLDLVARRPVSDRIITTSPIKGTRPRGRSKEEDADLRRRLLASEKDRAENVMIVDLLRNDIGRICRFGSVAVEKLCDLEEHPTLFHLVSTVTGRLRAEISFADVLRAAFPCGSVTGAPKIRTMQIIDEIENVGRGLSMGAIGYAVPASAPVFAQMPAAPFLEPGTCDLSVAIRTMVIRDREAVFNVGGGIVIDSIPEKEYEESLIKARALLGALNADLRGSAGTFS